MADLDALAGAGESHALVLLDLDGFRKLWVVGAAQALVERGTASRSSAPTAG